MEPKILFENDHFLVVDKPAGVIVNRSDTTAAVETLQDWSEKQMGLPRWESKQLIDTYDPKEVFLQRGGIVHRLDKETSGAMLIAKHPESFAYLQSLFKERKVKKTYLALAHGKFEQESGEISVPVGRLPWNRKQFGVVADGRAALTKYQVRDMKYLVQGKTKEPLTLVELYPETGRTHQIRVHLKYIFHPIFADFLYAGRKIARDDRKLLERVFLHAHTLSFPAYDPDTETHEGEMVTYQSPLPHALQTFFDHLVTA